MSFLNHSELSDIVINSLKISLALKSCLSNSENNRFNHKPFFSGQFMSLHKSNIHCTVSQYKNSEIVGQL